MAIRTIIKALAVGAIFAVGPTAAAQDFSGLLCTSTGQTGLILTDGQWEQVPIAGSQSTYAWSKEDGKYWFKGITNKVRLPCDGGKCSLGTIYGAGIFGMNPSAFWFTRVGEDVENEEQMIVTETGSCIKVGGE